VLRRPVGLQMRRFTLGECVSTQDIGGAGSCRDPIGVSVPVLAIVHPKDVGESTDRGIVRTSFLPKPEVEKHPMTLRSTSGCLLPPIRRWQRNWTFRSHVTMLSMRWRPLETTAVRDTAVAPGGSFRSSPYNRRCQNRRQPERWDSDWETALPPNLPLREAAASGGPGRTHSRQCYTARVPQLWPIMGREQAVRWLALPRAWAGGMT